MLQRADHEATALKAAIYDPARPRVRELASNPLLVTILALVFHRRGSLHTGPIFTKWPWISWCKAVQDRLGQRRAGLCPLSDRGPYTPVLRHGADSGASCEN